MITIRWDHEWRSSWDESKHPRGPDGKFGKSGDFAPSSYGSKIFHPESDSFYKGSAAPQILTGGDREAVLKYAWNPSNFERMNRALRSGPDTPIPDDLAEDIAKLTSAIDRHGIRNPTRVYRGVPDTPETRKWLASGGRKKLIEDPGFMSTSTDRDVAELSADPTGEGGGFIFEIKLGVGTKAISIGDQFEADGGYDQSEVLIQRNSVFKLGAQRKLPNGQTLVSLTLVQQGKHA